MKPRKAIQTLQPYVIPAEDREGLLRLDFNENTVGCSQSVITAIKKGLSRESLSIYPCYEQLRITLSKYTGLPQDYILATNGTEDAIKCVMDAYLDAKGELLIPTPTFALYKLYASVTGARIKEIQYREMGFPLKGILDSISKKTKVIAIANPNNPTGTLVPKNNLLKIIKKASNAIVLIDEAYFHYSGLTMQSFIKKYPNLVIIRTFSKAFGLAGIRLGYMLSRPENISALRRVQSPYSVNKIAVIAVEAAFRDKNYVKEYANEVKQARTTLEKFLAASDIPAYPSKANFIFAKFGDFSQAVIDSLRTDGILVKEPASGWLRIGVGTISQTKRLIISLKKILKRRAIIFDFDGVLVNVSRSYHYTVRDTVAHFCGKVISLDLIKRMKLKGGYNDDWKLTFDIVKSYGQPPGFQVLKRYFQSRYCGNNFKGFIRNETLIMKRNILEKLAANYTLAIVTGRPRKETEYALKKWNMKKYFETIISRDDLSEKYQKPHPAGILKAMKDTKAITAIYLGDNPDDMSAAKNAGITGIGVLPPQNRSRTLGNALRRKGASIILSDINRICEVL